jgi:hypothetical protein
MESNDNPLYESTPTKKSMGNKKKEWIFQTIEIYTGESRRVCFKGKGNI